MRSAALVALLLALSAPAPAGDPLVDARRALEAGAYREAEALFRELTETEPGLADAWVGLADSVHAQGRTEEAAGHLAYVGGGLADGGRLAEGVVHLERAVAWQPANTALRLRLGELLQRLQRYGASRSHLERVVAELPASRSTRPRLALAAAYWETGALDLAERTYRELVGAPEPVGPVAGWALGGLLVFRGRYEEALPLLAPRDGAGLAVRLDRARALEGTGREEEAIAAYRAALAEEPTLRDARYRLALLLHRRGRRDEAAEELHRFRALHDADQRDAHERSVQRARLDRGWELIGRGAFAEALTHFRGLAESVESVAGVATALAESGRQDEALALLDRAIPRFAQGESLRLLQARLLAERGL